MTTADMQDPPETPDTPPAPDSPGTSDKNVDATEGTLLSHLLELRRRLMYMFGSVLLMFIALTPFSRKLFAWLAEPLLKQLPEGTMIATQVASPFLTPFKLTFMVAVFLVMPLVLYQVWAFVAPGLYSREKRFGLPLLLSSVVLFYAGCAFAYYLVFPLVFGFFASTTPQGVEMMTDIGHYLDFVLALFLAFGLAFEVPVATVLVCWAGITNPKKLGSYRAYVLLGAFVGGMFLTPPDVVSQILLAVPIYLLYEVGIVLARVVVRPRDEDADDTAGNEKTEGAG